MKLSLTPDTYLLISLSDLERYKRLNECTESFYLDVFGEDAAAVVAAVVPPDATITTLPSGRIRAVLKHHPYQLNYQRILETGLTHCADHQRKAEFEIGSFHWAGHHVVGYECEGLKTFPEPISGASIKMLHVVKQLDVELDVDSGIIGLAAPPAPKAAAKPRRRTPKKAAASAK